MATKRAQVETMVEPEIIEEMQESITTLLQNTDNILEKKQMTTQNTADNHSNPDPRKNFYRSNVATSNMQMRLETELSVTRAEIEELDRTIAELQAKRTDLMRAYSMAHAGVMKGQEEG